MAIIEEKYILVKTNKEEMKALLVLSYLGYSWRGRESILKPLATVTYKGAFILIHHNNSLTYTSLHRENSDYPHYELMQLEALLKY